MTGDPVRLLIASPDRAVVAGLRAMLARHSDRVVVVDAAAAGAPHVPGVDVVLHDGDGDIASVLRRTGAASWVPLRTGIDRIVALVESAATGPDARLDHGLSDREQQVLALIAEGLTNREIADRVYVSINSVKTYIRSAYRKIGVSSRSQAVAWGLRHDIGRSLGQTLDPTLGRSRGRTSG